MKKINIKVNHKQEIDFEYDESIQKENKTYFIKDDIIVCSMTQSNLEEDEHVIDDFDVIENGVIKNEV